METVRWGLMSTALINRRVIPAIRTSERSDLIAVASRDRQKAEAYAADWEIAQVFGSYEEMLASEAVDAVYISLPNHLHAEWSIKAMEAGKHVLCEKPFAISVADVDQMIATADRTGRALAEAFMYRHHPQTKLIGEWIEDGRLGEITYFQGVFNFMGLEPNNVRLAPEMGGGALWDVGVYPLSLAQYVMGGPPEKVVGDQLLGSSGVDMFFVGQLRYNGGRIAHISCSFNTPFHTFAQIMGTKGTLTVYRPFIAMHDQSHLYFTEPDGKPELVPVPAKELYLGEVEDMNAAVLDGTPNYLTLAESRNHVRTVLALYESAQNNSQVVSLV
jgi:xylose dehydrogenase (NAD/NADP)